MNPGLSIIIPDIPESSLSALTKTSDLKIITALDKEPTLIALLTAIIKISAEGIAYETNFDDTTHSINFTFTFPITLLKFFNETLNKAIENHIADGITAEISYSKPTQATLYIAGNQTFYDLLKADLTAPTPSIETAPK